MFFESQIFVPGKGISSPSSESLMAYFQKKLASGAYPALSIAQGALSDLDLEKELAHRFRQEFETVIVLGTGGSSLGAQTLYSLVYAGGGLPQPMPRLYFMDNIDPQTFEDLLQSINPHKTGVLAISKSGTTAETLCQTLILLDHWKTLGAASFISKNFVFLTEPKDSPLRRLGDSKGIKVLDHHLYIGGRFSVLSNVGALPALIAGIDMGLVRQGAAAYLKNPLQAVEGSLTLYDLYNQGSIASTVLMPYLDRLSTFASWFRQLWAESLGKDGKGLTPIKAMGTVDQHSQTQLYLDGPQDKFFTFILSKPVGKGRVVQTADPDLSYLHKKTMGDLLEAEQRATVETLREKDCPVRVMQLDSWGAETLGALLAHFMVETILMAYLMGIDAFNQPAVERGKVLTRDYLKAL